MGALVKLAGVGCITLAGLAVFGGGGTRNTGGAGVGPPVLPPDARMLTQPVTFDPPRAAPAPLAKPVRSAQFSADALGQFWIDGTANGRALRFLADTGASNVVFSKNEARRLGLDVNRLNFNGWASTANGRARTASALLRWVTVGPFAVADVSVSVIDSELESPLLGMAFLRRLNVSIGNDTLTLSGEP